MGTSVLFESIGVVNTTALNTSFGPGSSGWASENINVRAVDFLSLFMAITKGDATEITLVLEASDNAGSVWHRVLKVDADNAGAEDQIVVALAADGNYVIRFDVRGLSRVRLLAKVDAATGSPAMTLKATGVSGSGVVPSLAV